MSEESLLILNMLREGKITADQADSLLRAVRPAAEAPPPPPPPPPPPHSAPPPPSGPSLADIQNKLGDLQGKLGELHGKQIAGQAARAAGQAAMFAGKVLDHLPRPDLDLNKVLDEAMRGLHSLKTDAVKTAKSAARDAAREARRMARESRNVINESGLGAFVDGRSGGAATGRPRNREGLPQASERQVIPVPEIAADAVDIVNPFGNVKAWGGDDADGIQITADKTVWAASDADARVLMQQVFVTSRIEGGRYKVTVVAPSDAVDRVSIDLEVHLPAGKPLGIVTTYGAIETKGVTSAATLRSASGPITVRTPAASTPGDSAIRTQSGDVQLHAWNTDAGHLTIETASGDIQALDLHGANEAEAQSHSGAITISNLNLGASLTAESVSGDINLSGGSVSTQATAKSQSGDVLISTLRAGQIHAESVSGDVAITDAGGALTLKTVSGDIHADAINSYAVALSTVSGDAEINFAAPSMGSLAGTTVSGDLAVGVWRSSDTRIELTTATGTLHSSLTLQDQTGDGERRLAGKLGEGAGSIRLQAISGDIVLREQK